MTIRTMRPMTYRNVCTSVVRLGLAGLIGLTAAAFNPGFAAATEPSPMVQVSCNEVTAILYPYRHRRLTTDFTDVTDPRTGKSAPGCAVRATRVTPARDDQDPPVEHLKSLMTERFWVPQPAYDADGHQGTGFALERHQVRCIFSTSWQVIERLPHHDVDVICYQTTP
ncbi:MAG: hypothetical protein ACE5FN_09205 [Leptospirillia bacterium]